VRRNGGTSIRARTASGANSHHSIPNPVVSFLTTWPSTAVAAYADVTDASASHNPATGSEVDGPADLVPISPTVFHDASIPGDLEFNQRTTAAFVLWGVYLECCCATVTKAMPGRVQSGLAQRGQLKTIGTPRASHVCKQPHDSNVSIILLTAKIKNLG
jgi:hypothetical protein